MESYEAGHLASVSFRQHLLLRRLLAGEGAASIDAYGVGETLNPVVHGISALGSLVIVAQAPDRDSPLHPRARREHSVRLDLVKDAADPHLMARVASVHALGTLRWLDLDESWPLPDQCVAALEALGDRGCVASIECPRLVMHDWVGVAGAATVDILADGLPVLDRDWELNWGTGCAPGALATLARGVRTGELRGEILPCEVQPSQHALEPSCFCLDADSFGLTLLNCDVDESTIIYLPLEPSDHDTRTQVARSPQRLD